jgi:hypothetical protein
MEELLQTDPVLNGQLLRLREYADGIPDCNIVKDYDATNNQYTTIYHWENQEAIDEFYLWANTNVGNYDEIAQKFGDLVRYIGGEIIRTITTDENPL